MKFIMKYEYNENHEIKYSETDSNLKLSLVSSMNLAQDMMTKYFGKIKSDNVTNKTKFNAIWVVTKTKVHFEKIPEWNEKIESISHNIDSKKVRILLETEFKMKENPAFVVIHECCPIDVTTRKIRRLDSISYPENLEIADATYSTTFAKLSSNFTGEDFVKKITVQPTDIDYNNHTNNVSYVRFIMNCFKTDFWDNKHIEEFEINYINESREGEELSIYIKEISKNIIDILIKKDDKEIVKARIKTVIN